MKCYECGKYFDEKLGVCPFCGAEVLNMTATKVSDDSKTVMQKFKNRIIAISVPAVCVIIAFVVLLCTVIIPNAKYKKFKSVIEGDYITFGTYEQDNDITNGKEDIEWLVLEVKDAKALVISKYALDCKQYNRSDVGVTWETCSLRQWLNSEFINTAFTEEEKSMIPMVTVTADPNPYYSTDPGNYTQDKVFCLSVDEAEKYFYSTDERQCQATAYAIANGVYEDSGDYCCLWWLRSVGRYQDGAVIVRGDGFVSIDGAFATSGDVNVRPAFWIELE